MIGVCPSRWSLKVGRGFALVTLTERTQMAKRVDARVVLIAPRELQRVVTDLLDVAQNQVPARDKLDRASMTLAMRARAITTENLMRENALVPIGPLDLHDLRAVRSLHACRLGLGITRHVRLPLLALLFV